MKGRMEKNRVWSRWMAGALAGLLAMGAVTGCGERPQKDVGLPYETASRTTEESSVETDQLSRKKGVGQEVTYVESQGNDKYMKLNQLGFGLLKNNMDKSNPLVSPLSAYLALAMAGEGAKGETRREFEVVLGDNMGAVSEELLKEWPSDEEGARLQLANSLWLDVDFEVKENWKKKIEKDYLGQAQRLELSSEATKNTINKWVSDKTRGLIPQMLATPFDESMVLALINTVYFKGDWAVPFGAEATRKADFRLEDSKKKISVDMMGMYGERLDCIKGDHGEGVILPYVKREQGRNLAFVALKPSDGMKVREMAEGLDADALKAMLDKREKSFVSLELPKLDVEVDLNLKETMEALGLKKVFDGGEADLSGMGESAGGNLFINVLEQKAVLKVDEKGTEAAAATMVGVECSGAMEEPYYISFDQPFLYFILDLDSGVPLFMGIVDQP